MSVVDSCKNIEQLLITRNWINKIELDAGIKEFSLSWIEEMEKDFVNSNAGGESYFGEWRSKQTGTN